ncbi:S-layer homology domain-containing protein, partial [Paramaledivibacter caminithermalis]
MKKIISMLITITLIAASTAFVFAEKGEVSQNEVGKIKEFTDLTKHWAKGYIDKLIALETINGYEDGTFKPDNPIKV